MPRSILVPARGSAKKYGAMLAAETPPLKDLSTPNAGDTAKGHAERKRRGKPFTKGNKAAENKRLYLERTGVALKPTDDERGRVQRRADSLRQKRVREMCVQGGGDVSSAVRTEIASWALAVAWSRFYYDAGDAVTGSVLGERGSAHLLKSTAFAERDAVAEGRKPKAPTDPLAAFRKKTEAPT